LRITEELSGTGHPCITATHRTTFEITRDRNLTKRGDCIIAVNATRGLDDLSTQFRDLCKKDKSRILVELEAEGLRDVIEGNGCRRLTLGHTSEIVGRRSEYISDRTLMINSDKAACDINRDLITILKRANTIIHIRFIVEL
jgi:hypothetical protein